jgi:hypothetical protein
MNENTTTMRVPPLKRRLSQWVLGLTVAGLAAATPTEAQAAPSPNKQFKGKGGNLGFGVTLGDPMGASLKYFFNANHAIQADIGWAPILSDAAGRIEATYLWHPGTFVRGNVVDFLGYVGIGTGVGFWGGGRRWYYCNGRFCDGRRGRGGAAWFLRLPVLGLALHWQTVPLDTVLEGSWTPHLIYPDPGDGEVSLKVRYYF